MRRVILVVFLLLASTLTACSYTTDFVVVNESDHAIEISYKHKQFPWNTPFEPHQRPAKVDADALRSKGGNEWRELTPSDYQIDRENRTVLVRIMPGEALRIHGFHNYGGHEDPHEAEDYPFEEISVLGANGVLKYTGQKARTAFSKVSLGLYTLTYN